MSTFPSARVIALIVCAVTLSACRRPIPLIEQGPDRSQTSVLSPSGLAALQTNPSARFSGSLQGIGRFELGPFVVRDNVANGPAGNGELTLVRVGANSYYGSLRVNGRVFEISGMDNNVRVAPVTVPTGEFIRPLARNAFPPPFQNCDDDTTLTVAVAYTPGVLAHEPTVATTKIPGAQGFLNFALTEAGVATRVAFTPVAVADTETGAIHTDLASLIDPGDGKWDALTTAPQDLVVLLVKDSPNANGAANIGASPTDRYAIVQIDAIPLFTLSHEFGHLAGADHQNGASPFADGHGHVAAGQFRTIMTEPDANCSSSSGCTRVNYFSNPSGNLGGVPLGTASTANVARVLGVTLPYLSSFSCVRR